MSITKKVLKALIITISSILALLILLSVTFLYLFTDTFNTPKLIYLVLLNDRDRIYRTDEIEDIFINDTGNYNIFLNNLKYCSSLKNLSYAKTRFKDLDFLNGTNLNSLTLVGKCDDWSQLSECNSIKSLGICRSNFEKISDIDEMLNINELTIYTNNILNYNGIENLVDLRSLSIYSPEIDIAEIVHRTDLTILSLGSNNIKHMELLSQMINLEEVRLCDVDIKLDQLSQLINVKSLKVLNLDYGRFDSSESEVKKITNKLAENGVEVKMEHYEYAG